MFIDCDLLLHQYQKTWISEDLTLKLPFFSCLISFSSLKAICKIPTQKFLLAFTEVSLVLSKDMIIAGKSLPRSVKINLDTCPTQKVR